MAYSLPALCRKWLDEEHARHSLAKHGQNQQQDFLRGDYWATDNFGGIALSYFARRRFYEGVDPEVSARRAQLSGKITATLDALYAGIVSLDGSDIPSAFSAATQFVEQHLQEQTEPRFTMDSQSAWDKLAAEVDTLEQRLKDGADVPALLSLGGTVLGQGANMMRQDFATCLTLPEGYLPRPSLTSGNIEPWDI